MRPGRNDAMSVGLARLTWPELLVLRTKLGRARQQSVRAALHAGSLQQVRATIRVINDLADLAGDVDRELARALPPWLPP
jgi:hypothetical protein